MKMNRLTKFLLPTFFILAPLALLAQAASAPPLDHPPVPTALSAFFSGLLMKYPVVAGIIALLTTIIATLRIPGKIVMTTLDQYAKNNLKPAQYATVVHYEQSRAVKCFSWFLDLICSIKVGVVQGASVASAQNKGLTAPAPTAAAMILIPIALSLALIGGMVGCKTMPNGQAYPAFSTQTNAATGEIVLYVYGNKIDPQAVGSAVQAAANSGARLAISKDPNAKDYFILADQALKLVAANGQINSAAIQGAFDSVSTDAIKNNPDTQAMILGVMTLVSTFEGQFITAKVDAVPYLEPVLQGIISGLDSATASTTAPATTK